MLDQQEDLIWNDPNHKFYHLHTPAKIKTYDPPFYDWFEQIEHFFRILLPVHSLEVLPLVEYIFIVLSALPVTKTPSK